MQTIEIKAPDLATLQAAGKALGVYVQDPDSGEWLWRNCGFLPDGTRWDFNAYITKIAPTGEFTTDPDSGQQIEVMAPVPGAFAIALWPDNVPLPDYSALGVTVGPVTPGGPVF